MSRAVLILSTAEVRMRAMSWLQKAPQGTRIEFKAPKRTLPQNDRLWASLTDVSRQVMHHGIKLTPDDWKLMFLDALKREVRIAPNLDGTGFVNLGRSSSDLSVSECSELLEIIYAWGAQNGVTFSEPETPMLQRVA